MCVTCSHEFFYDMCLPLYLILFYFGFWSILCPVAVTMSIEWKISDSDLTFFSLFLSGSTYPEHCTHRNKEHYISQIFFQMCKTVVTEQSNSLSQTGVRFISLFFIHSACIVAYCMYVLLCCILFMCIYLCLVLPLCSCVCLCLCVCFILTPSNCTFKIQMSPHG